MTHSRTALILAAGLASAAGTATASSVDLDFGIHDDASYQSFRDAVFAGEYVRYDYALDQKPRVVIAATGLAAFATRNPDATVTQLSAFINAFDAALRSFAPGDPDLQRSTNLMPAMRFTTPIEGVPELAGTDTRVGRDIERALGLEMPPIQSYEQIIERMIAFDRARVKEFANAPEWAAVLTAGFSGFNLEGNPTAGLAGALQTYLESQGFEPVPDGVDDDRLIPVTGALNAAMPTDYAGYSTLIAQPVEASPAWAQIQGAFTGIAAETSTRVSELNAALDAEQSLYDQIANADDPAKLQMLADAYRARLTEIADERASITANAMILLQSADPSVRELALQSQTFAGTQLQTNDTMAGITASIEYASALTTFGFGIATGNPADAITGLADIMLSSIELGDAFGGSSVPSAEEQIFDQLIEMRSQIEDVRIEMNVRFDRIEEQLSLLYDSVSAGFNELGASIDDLSLDVQALTQQVMLQRSALERIEDQLWGMADDIFQNDIALLINGIVGYRSQVGVDLDYSGAGTTFSSKMLDLRTWATVTASNTTYAGTDGSGFDPGNVVNLEVQPVGRNINDLRGFPQTAHLGFAQPLWPDRVVSPGAWAHAASAYLQVANESPWYFAFMYHTQTDTNPPALIDIERIIEEGEDFRSMAANARSESLFNALFDRYDLVIDAMQSQFDLVVSGEMSARSLATIDPWGGLGQLGRQHAPGYTLIQGQEGLINVSAPTILGDDVWDVIPQSRVPELASAMLDASDNGGTPTVELRMDSNGFFEENDVNFVFTVRIPRSSGSDFVFRRIVTGEFTTFGSPVYIGTDSAARDLLNQTPAFWFNFALEFYTGSPLTGTSHHTFNGLGDQITIDWVADTLVSDDPAAAAFVQSELDAYQDAIWTAAASNTAMDGFETTRDGWAKIIDAYVTLAMPDVLEQSTAVNAALRGNVSTSEISLLQPIDEWLSAQIGAGDNGTEQRIDEAFLDRSAIIRAEILHAASLPLAGHSLVEWTLAELRNLKANALKLAIDDTYVHSAGVLIVSPEDGLLRNDIGQEYRVIEIDPGFGMSPANGSVVVNPDGSFTYTPNPGFSGEDAFEYRTMSEITSIGSTVTSLPATVRLVITSPTCSAADTAEPFGTLNFFDVATFIDFYNDGDPAADFAAPFGTLNFFDIATYISAYNVGCP